MALIQKNGRLYDAVLASNPIDRLVNAAAFAVPFDRVHAIGLPRFDYFRADYAWPSDLERASDQLASSLGGHALLLYAPTFREHGTTLRDLLPPNALASILAFCARRGLVFGVRPHPYQQVEFDLSYRNSGVLDLGASRYGETAIVLRNAQYLVTDYSSLWVDYLYTGRPIFGYFPDLASYVQKDRSFIYDYEQIFPGPISATWDLVLKQLEPSLNPGAPDPFVPRREQAARVLLPSAVGEQSIGSRFVTEVVARVHRTTTTCAYR